MKYKITIIYLSIALSTNADTWTQKANFGGTNRKYSSGFSIGNKGYIGLGNDGDSLRTDFWEWDQIINAWTQKATFGGIAREHATGFSIGNKGYIGTGYNSGNLQDFWEWDQASNIWTQKSNFIGLSRYHAIGLSIGTKGYIGTGFANPPGIWFQDFWEYDPTNDSWTQKADFGGTARYGTAYFSIGNKGYVGTGYDGVDTITGVINDFWEYDQLTNTWSPKANFGGVAREHARGFAIGNKGYIGTGISGGVFLNDFWEWDPLTNIWTQKTNFPGNSRCGAVGFSIGNNGYIGTGYDISFLIDYWEYSPDTLTIQLPVASFYSSDTTFCGKQNIDFTDISTNNPSSWHWYFPGAIPASDTTQNPVGIFYNSFGSFDVTLIACNAAGCDTLSVVNHITEYQLPAVPVITVSNDTLFSTQAFSYSWYNTANPGVVISNDSFYVYSQSGSYYVLVSDSIGCQNSSVIFTITGQVELSALEYSLQLWPNPADDELNISFNGSLDSFGFEMKILNVVGQTVYSARIKKPFFSINIAGYSNGIYFVQLKTQSVVYNKKFVCRQHKLD